MAFVTALRGDISTVAQTVASGVWSTVLFDIVEPDGTNRIYSTVTGKFHMPATGVYKISSNVTWVSNTPGITGIRVIRNGEAQFPIIVRQSVILNAKNVNIETATSLAKDENIEIQVYQSSGGGLTIAATIDPNTVGQPGRTTLAMLSQLK